MNRHPYPTYIGARIYQINQAVGYEQSASVRALEKIARDEQLRSKEFAVRPGSEGKAQIHKIRAQAFADAANVLKRRADGPNEVKVA